MPEEKDSDTSALAQEIIRYLEEHPDAADSIEGIVKWWLKRQRYHDAVQEVEQALTYLVSEGRLVITRTTANSKAIYHKAKDK